MRQAVERRGLQVPPSVHPAEIEFVGDEARGIGVHLAARVMALAGPGEMRVTRTARDLVAGSWITFTDRGSHALRGVPVTLEVAQAVSAHAYAVPLRPVG